MAGENLQNGDGMLKDSYAGKKAVTPQASGFQKLAPFRKRMRGISFSRYSGGQPKGVSNG